jgi:hypothetical protein
MNVHSFLPRSGTYGPTRMGVDAPPAVRYIVDDLDASIGFHTGLLRFAVDLHKGPGFAALSSDGLKDQARHAHLRWIGSTRRRGEQNGADRDWMARLESRPRGVGRPP